MAIEPAIAALTESTTSLTTAVALQQIVLTDAIAAFIDVTTRVNTGLTQVDNTTDLSKPISNATQTSLDTKQVTLVSGGNISTINGQSLLSGDPLVIERSATSLNTVPYDSRANLRGMSPQLDDATVIAGLGLFMWINDQHEPDDDETCFTTSAGQWILRIPASDLITAWGLFEAEYFNDWIEDEPVRFAKYKLTN
jgi:hypothetical protein